jgi:FKBP-type peptidyl-prolyl cis-trans isomerase
MERVVKASENEAATKLKALAEKNAKAGETFRAEYKKGEGVKELPGGIQYRVLAEGKGDKPGATDAVEVNYSGKLIDGREFDASERHGGPVTLQLDKVIKGWQQAVTQMATGAKWEIVVPPELAYGLRGAGGAIGPNETLVFEIELVAVKGTDGGQRQELKRDQKPDKTSKE